ncbi:alkene reductase [Microbaculum marinum]|uniref:Alkene reductase n=1 Tax=Microbaculum marinum TaxID=1764581 RepID=A0AAW9RFV6_9HYPH
MHRGGRLSIAGRRQRNGSRTLTLFDPVDLGTLALKSRIVMAPMTRNRAGPGNVPGPLAATYYAQRASAGLVITEATQVAPEGQGYPDTPGLHSTEQTDGWRRVVDAVHEAGAPIVAQLFHVGRISHPLFQPERRLPVAPSPIRPAGSCYGPDWTKIPYETPAELDRGGIDRIVRQFGAAAANARAAGFDGVEIHAGNGYLVDQFLRDGTNRRSDGYGGPPENRARFLVEILEAVTAAWGGGDRIGVRLSPWNGYNDMADSDPAAAFPRFGGAVAGFGLAYVHVIEPADAGTPIARRISAAAGAPLIVNGGHDGASAARAVAAGAADAVSFARWYIANPDLPARLRAGLPLAEPDKATIYGGGAKGYTDYPPAG